MILSYSLLEQFMLLAIAAAVLVLIGLTWIVWTPKSGRDPIERLADAVGISISIIALVGMLFFFAGLNIPGWFIAFVLFGCFLALMAAGLLGKFDLSNYRLLSVFLIILVGLVLLTWRFYQAETLSFPAWVDSVHHVLVTQKIIDNAGVPATLAPELPVPLFYHYGFHITAALFSWLSHLPTVDAVLWLGQVINALLAVGIYRLGKSIWKKKRAAGIAALLVGLAFQMPAYYLTWGRYTLLTGLLVLLPAMAAAIEIIREGASRERIFRLVILTAGLSLTHYMALFFLGLFMAALLLVYLIKWGIDKIKQKQVNLKSWWACGLSGLGGVLIALPWLIRMISALYQQATVSVVLPGKNGQTGDFDYIMYLLGPKHSHVLLIAAGLFLVLAWWKKETRSFALWTTVMALLMLPWGFRFGPFRPDHYAIVLFIPASVLLGGGLLWLAQKLTWWTRGWIGSLFLLVVVSGFLGWGMKSTQHILNPVTILADADDRDAVMWIDAHLPPEARFLANTAHWIANIKRGVDGAYWITPVTRRFSMAMPGLYSYAEHENIQIWRDWIERSSNLTTCDEAFWSLVQDAQLTNLYLHEDRGNMQPTLMQDCPGVYPIYHRNGIWIYELIPQP